MTHKDSNQFEISFDFSSNSDSYSSSNSNDNSSLSNSVNSLDDNYIANDNNKLNNSDKKNNYEKDEFIEYCDTLLNKINNSVKDIKNDVKNMKKMYIKQKKKYKKYESSKKKNTGFTIKEVVPKKLANLINVEYGTKMSRIELTKKIFDAIKQKNLYYSKDRRIFRADKDIIDALDLNPSVNKSTKLDDKNGFNMYTIQKYITRCYSVDKK